MQGEVLETLAFLGWAVGEGKRGPKAKGSPEIFVPMLWVHWRPGHWGDEPFPRLFLLQAARRGNRELNRETRRVDYVYFPDLGVTTLHVTHGIGTLKFLSIAFPTATHSPLLSCCRNSDTSSHIFQQRLGPSAPGMNPDSSQPNVIILLPWLVIFHVSARHAILANDN